MGVKSPPPDHCVRSQEPHGAASVEMFTISSSELVAAATAAAAASTTAGRATGGAARRGRGAPGTGRGEDGKLDSGFLTGARGAGDFLLLVDDNFFEARFALVANVFVDGHSVTPLDSFSL